MKIHLIFCILILFLSCSSDGSDSIPTPTQPVEKLKPVTNLSLKDIANTGTSTDLQISFNSNLLEDIAEFKVFLFKSDNSSGVGLEEVKQIEYYVRLNNDQLQSTFPNDFLDTDGDPLEEGLKYAAFVHSIPRNGSGKTEVISTASNALGLEQVTVVRTIAIITEAGTGGLEVDKNGNLYMGDFGKNTNGGGEVIYKISPSGEVETFASGFNTASGNDFDSSGNLFQSSFDGKYISKVSPGGEVETFISDPLITGPVGIAMDENDNLFVADYRSNKILKITKDKTISVYSESSLLDGPNGLDLDQNQNLYVSNWNNTHIVKIEPNGEATVFADTPGNNAHMIIQKDDIYAVGRGLHNIHTININTGAVNPFLNNGRGNSDGSLSQAKISYPNDIAFSTDGNLMYINHVSTGPANGFVLNPTVIKVVDFAR